MAIILGNYVESSSPASALVRSTIFASIKTIIPVDNPAAPPSLTSEEEEEQEVKDFKARLTEAIKEAEEREEELLVATRIVNELKKRSK